MKPDTFGHGALTHEELERIMRLDPRDASFILLVEVARLCIDISDRLKALEKQEG